MRASLIIAILTLVFQSYGQNKKNDSVNGLFENLPLEVILDSLTLQTNYYFSYNSDVLPKGSLYTIEGKDTPIDKFLAKLLVGTGLKYSFFKDQIILNYEPPEERVLKKKNFFSISGKVVDENGQALSDVNVFLDGTTIGMSSDIDGNYKLETIPPGLYNIVFSHIGYETGAYQISELNGASRIQVHQMKPRLEELDEVEIISQKISYREERWREHFTMFSNEILGQSENAVQSVIENPEVINFSFDEDANLLRAFTKLPLQIRNDALGYRVSYFLEYFKLEDSDLRFRGKIRFKNLTPIKGSESRDWRRNRKSSYYGSFNHFKKSLLKGDLRKQGFRIYRVNNLKNIVLEKKNELQVQDIVVFKGDHYELDFKNYLVVEYEKEKESVDYLKNSSFVDTLYPDLITNDGVLEKSPGNQISVIRLLRNSVRLDLSGEVMDRFGLSTFGYWAWERTADLVPINYDPKYDNL